MLQFYVFLQNFLTKPLKKDDGATAVEYGLMVALIAVAIIAAVTAVGVGLDQLFDEVSAELPVAPAP